MKINIDTIKVFPDWKQHRSINKVLIRKVVKTTLASFTELEHIKEFELSLLFTDNSEMLSLNSKFLNKPKATNVLSFPDKELDFRHLLELTKDLNYIYLGDIAFGYEIMLQEALTQSKDFENHFIHLLIHSVLHLIGFDHQEDEETNIMEDLEVAILKKLGIASPY